MSTAQSFADIKIPIPSHLTKADAKEVQRIVIDLTGMIVERRAFYIKKKRAELVDFLVKDVPMKAFDMKLARLQARALESVYTGTQWLSAEQIGTMGKHGQANPGAAASRWKKKGQLFAIRHEGKDKYARYTLGDDFTPLPVMTDILKIFSGWNELRIAAWFESTSSFLDGKRPREVVSTNAELTVKAAQDAVNRLHD